MKKLTVNLDLFGPYVHDLYNNCQVLGFGMCSRLKSSGTYFVVSDETAVALLLRLPAGAISSIETVIEISEVDQFMAKAIANLQISDMPEVVLDFIDP